MLSSGALGNGRSHACASCATVRVPVSSRFVLIIDYIILIRLIPGFSYQTSTSRTSAFVHTPAFLHQTSSTSRGIVRCANAHNALTVITPSIAARMKMFNVQVDMSTAALRVGAFYFELSSQLGHHRRFASHRSFHTTADLDSLQVCMPNSAFPLWVAVTPGFLFTAAFDSLQVSVPD
jgi:hypothetical protein